MKHLPLTLAAIHAVFMAIIFGSAIWNPIRADLLPIVAFVIDFPLSFVFEAIRPRGNLLWNALIYLALGSLWYYFVGWILAQLVGTRKV
jgi:hypothetical protein